MKKILIAAVFAVIGFSACKKRTADVSTLYTYSVPTIIISGDQYYSIPVGGALPSITATAYDSFYHESYSVLLDQSTVDNTTPGLYVVTATAKNKYGMASSKSVYLAVTDISAAINLAGTYERTSNGVAVNVYRLANGLYMTDNVGGVANTPANASFILPAFFVQTTETEIKLPAQPTAQGILYGTEAAVNMAPADTTFEYAIQNAAFGTAVRTFKKI